MSRDCARCGQSFPLQRKSQGRWSAARYCDTCRPHTHGGRKPDATPEGLLDLRASGARSNGPLPPDAVRCEECGGHFISLSRHLATHGLTSKEYRARHPGALLQVPGLSRDQAERALRSFHGLDERRWTREKVIAALRREVRAGRQPRADRPGTKTRPSYMTITALFGGLEEALAAAGIEPVPKRLRQTRPAPPSWVEAWERGDRIADIARAAGVSKDQVRNRVRAAGCEPRPTGRPSGRKTVTLTCENCGREFECRPDRPQRACKRACASELRRVKAGPSVA